TMQAQASTWTRTSILRMTHSLFQLMSLHYRQNLQQCGYHYQNQPQVKYRACGFVLIMVVDIGIKIGGKGNNKRRSSIESDLSTKKSKGATSKKRSLSAVHKTPDS